MKIPLRVALCLLVLLLPTASAKNKPGKVYSEHGTVVSMRTERETRGAGVYTDPYGKTRGGQVHTAHIPVYRVRTADMDFELEGKRGLTIGDEISFRVENSRVYVRLGDKEQKFTLVGQEKR